MDGVNFFTETGIQYTVYNSGLWCRKKKKIGSVEQFTEIGVHFFFENSVQELRLKNLQFRNGCTMNKYNIFVAALSHSAPHQ